MQGKPYKETHHNQVAKTNRKMLKAIPPHPAKRETFKNRRTIIGMTAKFLEETMKARRQWEDIFKVVKNPEFHIQ